MKNKEENLSSYLRKIDEALYSADKIPLISGFYPLNINELSKHLSDIFSLKNFSISIGTQEWKQKDEIEAGFLKKPKAISLLLSPLPRPVFLLIDQEDEKKFTNWAIPTNGFESKKLQSGFFQFIFLKTLESLEEANFFPELNPKITEKPLPEKGFCIDLTLKKGNSSITTRLVLSDPFRKDWNQHFVTRYPLGFSEELAEKTELFLSFKLGSVLLNEKEIGRVGKGDFILLDSIHFNPKTKKGSLRVFFDKICLFRAKISENRIKLLEYSLYHEELPMQENDENISEEESISEEENVLEEKEISVKAKEEKPGSLLDVPLELCVEVTKVSITLSQLKELRPGNYLSLPISLENGVNLTINNRVIGRAELVYIGEKLGVKILEWGKKNQSL